MPNGEEQEPIKWAWIKRPSWCQCDPPYREELEAITALLVEGYISTQEARISLEEARESIDFMRESMAAFHANDPVGTDVAGFSKREEDDLRIAMAFVECVEAIRPFGVASRSEHLRRIVGQYRSGELGK